MNKNVLVEEGWTLEPPGEAEIDELMEWFPDARSVDIWGGPEFRYPFTRESFVEDCQPVIMSSYCLRDPNGAMAAFGQFYDRHGRAHLARLITNPAMRRRGAGKRLISLIIKAATQSGIYTEASLFVYRDNAPAYECYLASGFRVQDYPADAKMKARCFFLTRPIDVDSARPA